MGTGSISKSRRHYGGSEEGANPTAGHQGAWSEAKEKATMQSMITFPEEIRKPIQQVCCPACAGQFSFLGIGRKLQRDTVTRIGYTIFIARYKSKP